MNHIHLEKKERSKKKRCVFHPENNPGKDPLWSRNALSHTTVMDGRARRIGVYLDHQSVHRFHERFWGVVEKGPLYVILGDE